MNVTGLSSVRFMYWGLDYVHGARCQMVRDQVVKFWCLPPNNRGLLGYIHHEEIQKPKKTSCRGRKIEEETHID